MRVMTIVGTRPEIVKLSRVIPVLDDCVDHLLVHTGQNYDYELNGIFFSQLGIRKPDYFLEAVGNTLGQTVGNIISKSDNLMTECLPDAVLVLGDTNSCLSVYPAKRHQIPIFHMEAGNRCYDFRVPEEINRRIVDHMSDINMVYTEHARRYLLKEGFPPDQIIKTGSPQKEVLTYYQKDIESSMILQQLQLKEKEYFIVSIHREENVDNPVNLKHLINSMNAIANHYKFPLIFSCHPRTRDRIETARYDLNKQIRVLHPLGFLDYVLLQMHAYCTISDSGTITEESSILGYPAITVRQAHERPEGMDEGTIIMAGIEEQSIMDSIELTLKQFERNGASQIVSDYDVPQVSWKVVKIILSYTDFINRRVWNK